MRIDPGPCRKWRVQRPASVLMCGTESGRGGGAHQAEMTWTFADRAPDVARERGRDGDRLRHFDHHVPVLVSFPPLPQTPLLVGVVHWFGDIWKMLLFRQGVRCAWSCCSGSPASR